MAKYYRNGKLVSQDTIRQIGTRTLAGATEEDLWSGTATSRPAPGGIQLRLVSSSIQDDQLTVDTWTCTIGGTQDTGDIARLTLNGTNFDTAVETGNTAAQVAANVATGAMSGTYDTWTCTVGGAVDAGDVATLDLDGTPYNYTVLGGDTTTNVATGIAAAAAADPNYDVMSFNAIVRVKKKVRGANAGSVQSSYTTDPGTDSTFVRAQTIVGVNGQTAWTVTSDNADVIATHATAGATADTVASTMSTDPGLDSTFVAVHTITGADGTGIRQVRIDYLDSATGARASESVDLNGTTAVTTTATSITTILGISATEVGSGMGAAGTVSITNVGNTVTYASIAAGSNQAFFADYSVPTRHQAHITAIHASASTALTIRVRSDVNPATGEVVANGNFVLGQFKASTTPATFSPIVPLGPIPATGRVWLTAQGALGNTVEAVLEGYVAPSEGV